MPWYEGPTLVEALDSFRPAPRPVDLPLRLPVQDIYKFDDRRIIAGRIESGRLAVGDRLLFSPSSKTAIVNSIEGWNVPAPALQAQAGESVGLTLDEQIFIERGEIASHARESADPDQCLPRPADLAGPRAAAPAVPNTGSRSPPARCR